jgi:hypothetical protein
MSDPGREASRAALQRIEYLLGMARDNITQQEKKTEEAGQYIEDAYVACDDIGRDLGNGLKSLIDAARKDMKGFSTAATVAIDIKGALDEVPNVRKEL